MGQYAIIIMASSDTPEGRGRMIHALTAAEDLKADDHVVKLLFEGIGVTWLSAFHTRDHPFTENYGSRFDALKADMMGACNFCASGRFDAGDAVAALGINLLGEEGGHYSLGGLASEGYQFLTF